MRKIFYSWQSDLDKKTCRNLIERALLKAISQIQDAEVEDADRPSEESAQELALDKDTQGVPGSPPIAETIFKKIDQAALFVPDLTSVARRPDGRLCSNPNVLIEYGWALKCLSHSRIIPVMNTAHGAPSATSLPFDMIHLRHPITFHCPVDATDDERSAEREALTKKLRLAIVAALGVLPKDEPPRPKGFVSPYPDFNPRFSDWGAVGVLHGSMYPMIAGDHPSMTLPAGPSMWLRLMPQVAGEFDIPSRAIEDAFRRDGLLCLPLNRRNDACDTFYIRGENGFGACVDVQSSPSGPDKVTKSLVFAMSSGEVWSIDTAYMDQPNMAVLSQEAFVDALNAAAKLLRQLGVSPPYRWVAGLDGARNRRFVEWKSGNSGGQFLKNLVVESGVFDGDEGAARAAIDPFFKALRYAAHMA